MIVLAPGSLEECYTQTVRAFNLAARFMTPVMLLLDETIGHMQARVRLPEISELEIYKRREFCGEPKEYKPYEAAPDAPATLNPFFKGYHYHITGLHHGATGFPTEDGKIVEYSMNRLFNKINLHTDECEKFEEFMLDDAEICIIAFGSVALSAKQAILNLREKGLKVGLFKPLTLFPAPAKKLKEISNKFKKILVCELNLGQYSGEISKIILRDDFAKLLKANGRPISPSEIEAKIGEIYGF